MSGKTDVSVIAVNATMACFFLFSFCFYSFLSSEGHWTLVPAKPTVSPQALGQFHTTAFKRKEHKWCLATSGTCSVLISIWYSWANAADPFTPNEVWNKQTKKKKINQSSSFTFRPADSLHPPPPPSCDQILAVSCNAENLKEVEAIVTFTYCSTSVIFASVSLHIAAAVVFQPSASPSPSSPTWSTTSLTGMFFGG